MADASLTPRAPAFVLCRDLGPLPAALARPVIAVGNFDGLHAGHRAVVAAARNLGRDLARPVAVLTFEPHPRSFFAPERPVFRLTPEAVKADILARLGIDGMIVLTFDAALAATSAADFVDRLLADRFAAAGLVVGYDFHFGRGRAGSPAFLAERAEGLGIPVRVVGPIADGAEPVSSSLVRAALERGDIARANRLLGYRWFVRAVVERGEGRGRGLGYPTANLRLPDDCGLRHGIYAVRASLGGAGRDGVASFGRRPTFDDGPPLLEVHVFDLSDDLYGRMMEVEFCGFLRPEERFASVAALVARMDRDSAEARLILAAMAGVDAPASMIEPAQPRPVDEL